MQPVLQLVERWRTALGPTAPGAALTQLGSSDGVVLFARGRSLVALDPRTGALRWRQAPVSALGATICGDVALVVSSRDLVAPLILNAVGDSRLYELSVCVLGLADGRLDAELRLPQAVRLGSLAVDGHGPSAMLWALGEADGERPKLWSWAFRAAGSEWRAHEVPEATGALLTCSSGLACMVERTGLYRVTATGLEKAAALHVRALQPLLGTGDLLAIAELADRSPGLSLVRVDGERLASSWCIALDPALQGLPGEALWATSPRSIAHLDPSPGWVTVREAETGRVRLRADTGVQRIQRLAFVGGDLLVCGRDARGHGVLVIVDGERGGARFAARAAEPLIALGTRLVFQSPAAAELVAVELSSAEAGARPWGAGLQAIFGAWSRPISQLLSASGAWSPRALHLFACAVATRLLDLEDGAKHAPPAQLRACERAVEVQRAWVMGTATDRDRRAALSALEGTVQAASAARLRLRRDEDAEDRAAASEEVAAIVHALLDVDPVAAAAASDRSRLEPALSLSLLVGAHVQAGVEVPDELTAALMVELDALVPGASPLPAWLLELDGEAVPALAARLAVLIPPARDLQATVTDAPLRAWALATLRAARNAELLEISDERIDEAAAAVAEVVAEASTGADALTAVAALLLDADFVDEVYASDEQLAFFLTRLDPLA